jgi:hypothetical protein
MNQSIPLAGVLGSAGSECGLGLMFEKNNIDFVGGNCLKQSKFEINPSGLIQPTCDSLMSTFRSWSRRAYVLHGYLMAMLILLPVPHGRLLVAEDEPPPDPPPEEEVWWFDHSESMVTVSLGSSGEAPLGADVTLQALVEATSWDVYTSS